MRSTLTDSQRVERLAPPAGPVHVVLDTDTFNEVDDQFALTYALFSGGRIELEAVHAAPFHNGLSSGPADGMARSFNEIKQILDLTGRTDVPALRGSDRWMASPDQPVDSPAARDLIERSKAHRDGPLYVAAIAAITNVASAILLDPSIVERIVVCWLGGQPHDWPTADEFNLSGDVHASRVLLDSGVPLVQFPCQQVAEMLRVSRPEIDRHFGGRGKVGDYLAGIIADVLRDVPGATRVIWDLAPVAWLVNPQWVRTALVPTPLLTAGLTYSADPSRPLMREAVWVDRDAVFKDLIGKLPKK